jgi:tRNA (guanine-N7-)-methyltransferase
MVTAGMRRYKVVRSAAQDALIGQPGTDALDPVALFGALPSGDSRPLRLEIGFGHGEFITAMAAAHPDEAFIGVEHDPLRVNKTAHKCAKTGLDHVRLYSDEAHGFVRFRLPPASVHRVYILFPDPWPKPDHRRRRLMSRSFLLDLARVAAPGCRFMFASDTHNYALQVLSNTTTLPGLWRNLYPPSGYRIDIPTRFPTLFEAYKKGEGCTIAYVHLERTAQAAPEPLPWASEGNSSRKANLRRERRA